MKEPMKLMKKYPFCFSRTRELNYKYFDNIYGYVLLIQISLFIYLKQQGFFQIFILIFSSHLKLRILVLFWFFISVLFWCYFTVLFVAYCYIYNIAAKHTIDDEDLVLSGDSKCGLVAPCQNMKAIVALMNIQALSHLDLQGIANTFLIGNSLYLRLQPHW